MLRAVSRWVDPGCHLTKGEAISGIELTTRQVVLSDVTEKALE